MKKFLGLTALVVLFTCCDVGVKNTSASSSSNTTLTGASKYDKINKTVSVVDGIEYHIYTKTSNYTQVGGIHVVNHTKEKLEVELLTKQLAEIKNNQNL
jgi:hypothetical protein